MFLVRHGDTRQTDEGRLYTDPEAELTEKGRDQMRAVAEWLKTESPQKLFSSSSKRVKSSADIIAAQLSLDITLLEAINAWRVGAWEGRTYLEVKKAEPGVYEAWVADPVKNAPPQGEAIKDVSKRATDAVKRLITENEGKRIALISHAEVVRALLVDALGMPLENYWRISVPTGSIAKVDYSASFATVHYISLRPHSHVLHPVSRPTHTN
jgi:broad specificity phosphatase PhoE